MRKLIPVKNKRRAPSETQLQIFSPLVAYHSQTTIPTWLTATPRQTERARALLRINPPAVDMAVSTLYLSMTLWLTLWYSGRFSLFRWPIIVLVMQLGLLIGTISFLAWSWKGHSTQSITNKFEYQMYSLYPQYPTVLTLFGSLISAFTTL